MKGPVEDSLKNPKTQLAQYQNEDLGLKAMRIANAVAFPMVLRAAVGLGVFCVIQDVGDGDGAWLSPSEIAHRLPTRPKNSQAPMLLDRMLRVLASYSILKCRTVRTGENGQTGNTQRVYAAEPICRFLSNGDKESGSVASLFMLQHCDVFLNTWSQLQDVVLEGGDAFSRAHGVRLFDYMDMDKKFSHRFNRAVSECTAMIMKKFLEIYKGFEGVNSVVDVGGGIGTALAFITAKYPMIRGINFDLASVLAQAPSYPGVEHVAGDMFLEVPKGDAIFMKRILHDWTDDECLKILKNCWKSLPERGKMVIMEIVTPDDAEISGDVYSNVALDMDMLMLTQCSGGKERAQIEFEALAMDSGFTRCEFICRAYHCWVIQLYKGV